MLQLPDKATIALRFAMANRHLSLEEVVALLHPEEEEELLEPFDDPHEVLCEGSDDECGYLEEEVESTLVLDGGQNGTALDMVSRSSSLGAFMSIQGTRVKPRAVGQKWNLKMKIPSSLLPGSLVPTPYPLFQPQLTTHPLHHPPKTPTLFYLLLTPPLFPPAPLPLRHPLPTNHPFSHPLCAPQPLPTPASQKQTPQEN